MNLPLAYVRGKIKSKLVLVKILIDSGNLCNDLISEKLAKCLNLKIDKSIQRNVGTACSNGKVQMVGRTQPICIYLEGLKYPVIIEPWVIRDLAHPVNLGEKFLRRYNANLQFMSNCIRLKIKNHSVDLRVPSFKLTENSVDSRIKPVVDWYKYAGKNPAVSSETTILDLRKHKPLPGLNLSERENEQLNVVNRSFPVFCRENRVIRAGTAIPLKIAIENRTSHEIVNFLFQPEKDSKYVSEDVLFHEGLYSLAMGGSSSPFERGEGKSEKTPPHTPEIDSAITCANYGFRDINVVKGDLIGTAYLVETEKMELNVLTHKPPKDLSKEELIERYQFIKDSLDIEGNEILKANPSYKEKVIDIFMKNFDSLAISEFDYGRTNLAEFQIQLEPGAKPVKMKARPLNPIQEKSLEKQIKAWLEAKVIEPANSPWSAALVPVRKKDTEEIRWCIDYRQLNAATVDDAYQLSRIDTSLQKLAGSKIFSILDSAGAFHTIPVEKESRPYTAFSSAFGQYQFLRLPFGVKNGVPAYSRLIDKALSHLPQTFAMAYVDDLIIFSKNVSEHLGHLEEIVKIHARAGMKIKLRKCKIFANSVNYLGHMITAEGIQMVPKYVEKIMDWPLPRTGKELKSFLGFCGYYRSFIPNYSSLTAELESLKMEEDPEWTDETRLQFKNLKEAFRTAPVRGYPDYESPEPFIVDTDFSGTAQAGILSQVQGGREKFLGCVAKKNNEAEKNYPSYKGELAAIIFTLRRFEHILRAKKFIIRTDSGPLQYLKTCKKTSGIFARYHNYLSTFNFDVIHRPGKIHVTADALSRRDGLNEEKESKRQKLEPKSYLHGAEDSIYVSEEISNIGTQISETHPKLCVSQSLATQNSEKSGKGKMQRETGVSTRVKQPNKPYRDAGDVTQLEKPVLKNMSETNKVYLREQMNDPNLLKIRNWVELKVFPTDRKRLNKIQRIYFGFRTLLRICPKSNLLYIEVDNLKRICVPESMVSELFNKFHSESGHPGLHETVRRLKQHFYFPNMQAICNLKIVNCVACLGKFTSEHGDRKAKPSHHTEEWLYFNQNVYIDLVGPLAPCRFRGKTVKYILTMQDGFTRFLAAVPVEDMTADVAARALLESWCFVYGCPLNIKSDNGTNFTSGVFASVLKSLNIKQSFSPVYNPQSNRVERAHQVLMRYFRTSENSVNWASKLQSAVFWLNSSLNRITGVSPFKALFGADALLPINYIVPKIPDTVYKDFVSLITEKQDSMRKIHDFMVTNQAEYAKILDQNSNPEKYKLEVGDTVFYFTAINPEKGTRKLVSHWTGPYLVHKIISDSVVMIRLQNPETQRMRDRLITVNVARVRKITSTENKDDKYFFSAKPIPNQQFDESRLADALDRQYEDALDGQIIMNNELDYTVKGQSVGGKADIENPLQDEINADPEVGITNESGSVSPEMDFKPDGSGLTGPESQDLDPDEPLPPRKAKLKALENLKDSINEFFTNLYL